MSRVRIIFTYFDTRFTGRHARAQLTKIYQSTMGKYAPPMTSPQWKYLQQLFEEVRGNVRGLDLKIWREGRYTRRGKSAYCRELGSQKKKSEGNRVAMEVTRILDEELQGRNQTIGEAAVGFLGGLQAQIQNTPQVPIIAPTITTNRFRWDATPPQPTIPGRRRTPHAER